MRKLGSVVVVFAGLLVLTGIPQLLEDLISAYRMWSDSGGINALVVLGTVLPLALALGILAGLLSYRHRWTDMLFPDEPLEFGVTGEAILRVAILIVGISMIAWSIPSILGSLLGSGGQLAQMQGMYGDLDAGLGGLALFAAASILVPVLQLIVGVVLIRKSSAWSKRLWERPGPADPAHDASTAACPSCGASYDPTDYVLGARKICSQCSAELPDA